MRIRQPSTAGSLALLVVALHTGCGDDAAAESASDDDDNDAGMLADAGGDEDAGEPVGKALAVDAMLDADAAAIDLCRLMPWVIGRLTENQLPASKVTNVVRDDLMTFVDDKTPICVDDKDSMEDLCVEDPTETTTYTYLYRSPEAMPTDPVEQVWCKSDHFGDLALIEGAEDAARGECETLQNMVVTWAEAKLSKTSTRSLKYVKSQAMTGSEWSKALVETAVDGDVLTVTGRELYVGTKAEFIEENGSVLAILKDNFFGSHYCKVLSPAAVLAWLEGT